MARRLGVIAVTALLLAVLLAGRALEHGVVSAGPLAAPLVGTAFTYQGQIKQGGAPVNATCDFQFKLFDTSGGAGQIGSTITLSGGTAVVVTNGLFTVTLDFGTSAFNGETRFLEIAPKCPTGVGSFITLTPRQPLTPTPYALALPGLFTQQNATSPNVVGGVSTNAVTSGAVAATIAGGGTTAAGINRVTDTGGTVAGGQNNRAGNNDANTTNAPNATVGGGINNIAGATTATVGGGDNNSANGTSAAVGGGANNVASGAQATVPGGLTNSATAAQSFAAGYRAKANHTNSYVWSDFAFDNDFASSEVNQYSVRATGNSLDSASVAVRFVTGVDVEFGSPTTGVKLTNGDSAWSALSDRNAKTNFSPVDTRAVLERLAAIPVETWSFRAQHPERQDQALRHMGPMAQDFYAAFGLGSDERHINTIDADGVAFAAIQGLYEVIQERDAEVAALRENNVALAEQLAGFAARLAALEHAERH